MRWKTGRRSSNVEDRRGTRGRVPRGIAGGGLGLLLLVLVGMFFGVDPSMILNSNLGGGGGPSLQQTQTAPNPAEDQLADFVSVVLGDTEDTWTAIFRQHGGAYEKPKLVLFSGAVQSACGFAQAATGPFYCPADRKVYIDLRFYNELKNNLNAPGDFAQAYVIAHEIGHHVQNLLGISSQVEAQRARLSKVDFNRLSVMLELQADCFAGVWANYADRMRNILEPGDVEEALNAASMIGDDNMQRRAQGYVVPDSFTHGSSRQRVAWFRQGLESGDMNSCDTFGQ
ncbi:MAG: KPN_02809 family neutral zinc metallopeptidase [Desulforhopalus sp.]